MNITMKFPKRKLNLKRVDKTSAELKRLIETHVKDTLKHFKDPEGGWNLDKEFLVSEILYEVFGFHIGEEINQAFMNAGLKIVYTDNKSFVALEEDYKPIYMNKKTGTIHLVENTYDNTYVSKFSEAKGYVQIGRL